MEVPGALILADGETNSHFDFNVTPLSITICDEPECALTFPPRKWDLDDRNF